MVKEKRNEVIALMEMEILFSCCGGPGCCGMKKDCNEQQVGIWEAAKKVLLLIKTIQILFS